MAPILHNLQIVQDHNSQGGGKPRPYPVRVNVVFPVVAGYGRGLPPPWSIRIPVVAGYGRGTETWPRPGNSYRRLWIARGQATHTEKRGATYLAGSLHRDASVLHSYFMGVYYTSFYFAFHAIGFKPGFDGTIGLLARLICHVGRAARSSCLSCLPCLPTSSSIRRGSRGHCGDGGLRNSRLLLRLRAPLQDRFHHRFGQFLVNHRGAMLQQYDARGGPADLEPL